MSDPILGMRLGHAARILAGILSCDEAADRRMARYFREHPELGGQDRPWIGDRVYGVLRHFGRLEAMTSSRDPERLLMALEDPIPPGLPPHRRHSAPEWLWNTLADFLGEEETASLFTAINQPAPLDLRVNTLKTTRDKVLAGLLLRGFEAKPTPHSPVGIRLGEKRSLANDDLFRLGEVEIQDEGSQLLSPLLTPHPGNLVIDLCAGAGGKSLHLAALLRNSGKVVAADTSPERLGRLPARAKRAGSRIITTLTIRHERDKNLAPFLGKADAVLVDAPCSGTGQLRRNPEIKWRLAPEQIHALAERQASLLDAAALLLRPGGRLLYATCSLLPRENQEIAHAFLRHHRDFILEKPHHFATKDGFFQLFPHISQTDGFFAALFRLHCPRQAKPV